MHLPNAYIDESVHDDHGLYVIAAVLASPATSRVVEATFRAVVPADRLPHWHVEDEPTREKPATAVAGLGIDAKIYGCRYVTSRRAEAARARAVGWFLSDVDAPVREIVLGERQRKQDAKERRVLRGLLGPGDRTTYRHAPVSSEPLLWVADVVVGAACATWLRGADHLATLRPVLSHCEREPD